MTYDEIQASDIPSSRVWAPLIEPLGEHTTYPLGVEAIVGWRKEDSAWPRPRPYFSCNALQPNGDCGVYGTDKRPQCCAEYPYRNQPCELTACTWDDGRVRLIPVEALLSAARARAGSAAQ